MENGESASASRAAAVGTVAAAASRYYRPHTLQIDGLRDRSGYSTAALPQSNYTGKTPDALHRHGRHALAVPLWEPLKKELADRSDNPVDLTGSPVDPASAGHGLAGAVRLRLPVAHRGRIRRAGRPPAAGGPPLDRPGRDLLPLHANARSHPARRAGTAGNGRRGAPRPGTREAGSPGTAGRCRRRPPPRSSSGIRARSIDDSASERRHGLGDDARRWVTISLNAPLLIGFILVFAVLVGPVNLFWLADASRRHRLFWSTPLISVAASLLLVGVIALQDGFGGSGERVMATLLVPDEQEDRRSCRNRWRGPGCYFRAAIHGRRRTCRPHADRRSRIGDHGRSLRTNPAASTPATGL